MARHKCPNCGSPDNAMLYSGMRGGPLTPEEERAVALGRVRYTGCLVTERPPRWACNRCHVLFGMWGERPGAFTWTEDTEEQF